MAGPLGTIAPTTDPNWAWDTIGWTNQGNTGDTQTSSGTTVPGFAGDPGGSGLLARTMDPDDIALAGVTLVTNTGYFGLVWIPEDISTKSACWFVTTTGASTHSYASLVSVTGVPVVQTADQTSTLGGSGAAGTAFWAGASATVSLSVAAGYYYLGIGVQGTVPVLGGSSPSTVLVNKLSPTAYATTPPYARWITGVPNGAAYSGTAPTSFGTLTISAGVLGGIFVGMF